jgi:uncharacterized protein (TIGR00369 family)
VTEPEDANYQDLRLRYAAVPAHALLGLSLEKLGSGIADVRMHANPSVINPNGSTHAGVLGAMIHSALLQSARTLLHHNDTVTALEVSVNFLLAGRGTAFVCSAEVVQLGESVGVCEARLTDSEGATLAVARAVLNVKRHHEV